MFREKLFIKNNKKDKTFIYIVLSSSDSIVGNTIKYITEEKYNHVSLSLSDAFDEMFSFSMFTNGMIRETFYTAYEETEKVAIYRLEVAKEKVNKLKDYITDVESKHNTYNFKGLLTAALKIKTKLEESYFCSWFVSDMLKKAKIINYKTDPSVMSPVGTVKNIKRAEKVFEGKIKDIRKKLDNLNKR